MRKNKLWKKVMIVTVAAALMATSLTACHKPTAGVLSEEEAQIAGEALNQMGDDLGEALNQLGDDLSAALE